MKFIEYFPQHNIVPRPQQIEIMEKMEKEWDNYKYFFVDAPVGVGKTYVALALADKLKRSYLLTSTKMLQQQYENHSAKIVNLKGRGNYQCNVDPNFYVDAAPCLADKALKSRCMNASRCEYYNQKNKALAAQMMITNYAYFLYAVHCGPLSESEEESPWIARDALIMDEAHELESHLVSFAETKIKLSNLKDTYGIGSDEWQFTDSEGENYELMMLIKASIENTIQALKAELESIFNDNKSEKMKKITRAVVDNVQKVNTKLNMLDKILQRIKVWVESRDTEEWLETADPFENSITISPLTASHLFTYYMEHMAEKFVFMSATMGSAEVMCKELGIPRNEVCVIRVGTPFAPEKSPITVLPVGKMNYRELDKTLVNVISAVEAIMDHHADDKGIIHTGNYKIAKYIYDNIDPDMKTRLITRDMFDGDTLHNEKLLKMHHGDPEPTVLLSPSMTTGIDLYGDLSRFQIIVKLPFTSLADPRVKKKSEIDSKWYNSKMWITLLQSTGRSTRSEDDFAITYILDSSFDYFYRNDYTSLPSWFKDRVEAQ